MRDLVAVLPFFLLAGLAYAFDKVNTLNLNTPYDYNSVMQYHRSATEPLIRSFKILNDIISIKPSIQLQQLGCV